MTSAYVDSSLIVALELGEPGSDKILEGLTAFDHLLSSPLLEAEVKSALHREGKALSSAWLRRMVWVSPQTGLGAEIGQALQAGYLRGADLWHVACALFFVERPEILTFATLDSRQGEVAAALGFPVWPG